MANDLELENGICDDNVAIDEKSKTSVLKNTSIFLDLYETW
jgi:hypothetical protein